MVQHLERGGVRYFVTGGGGAPLYRQSARCPSYDQQALRLFRSESHFLRVRVRGEAASLDALSPDGVVLESVALHLPAPREAVAAPIPFRHVAPGTPATTPRADATPAARPWGWLLRIGGAALALGLLLVLFLRRRSR